MDTKKFDTCIFRTKEKHPITPNPHACGRCPKPAQEDVYKCLKLLIEPVTPDICFSCVHYTNG